MKHLSRADVAATPKKCWRFMQPKLSIFKPIVFTIILFCHFSETSATTQEQDFEVHVETHDSLVIVDSNVKIRASPEEVWNVLTDFDHMGRFISGLTFSRIVSKPGDRTVLVEQKGTLSYGPFSIDFNSIKLNELTPFSSIQSSLVSGSFKRFDSTTTLIADGEITQIVYHAEAIPDAWLPPIIGSMLVRSEARLKFNELRDEIRRRKQPEKK